MIVNIKPLSVNQAWKGRRFKTDKYHAYYLELMSILPAGKAPEGDIKLTLVVGYSSKLADIDNFQKPFIDILQVKYNFNDRNIKKLNTETILTSKGKEFIYFKFEEYKESELAKRIKSARNIK